MTKKTKFVWGDFPQDQLIFEGMLDVRLGEEVHINEAPVMGRSFTVRQVSHHFTRENGEQRYTKTLILE